MTNTEAVLLVLLGLLAGIIVSSGPVQLHRSYWRKRTKKPCPARGSISDNDENEAASRAVNSYVHYETVASRSMKRRHRYFERLPMEHYSKLRNIGHIDKLLQLDHAIRENSKITNGIATLSKVPPLTYMPGNHVPVDIDRVRESLQHFYRDWSQEGISERHLTSLPILSALPSNDLEKKAQQRILIPGSGHCRLAYDISRLGYKVDAVENSYFMTLAAKFIFSRRHTPSTNCHKVNPWIHWLSHQQSAACTLRPVYFPDILPVPLDHPDSNLSILEEDFLFGLAHRENYYDVIITLFFIDTADNVIDYLERIHSLLKPKGVWINLGPLLWPSSSYIELDLDEVIKLCHQTGLIPQSSPTIIPTEYTSDKNRLIKYLYHAAFWTCTKELPST